MTSSKLKNPFLSRFSFQLDPFQLKAMEVLERGKSVLVAAPTGAGKTIVGEYAVQLAIENDKKVFYTAPIKALSNQKYQELSEWLGHERVGLITGDTNINSEAQVVVMTTEILRNMMYAGSKTLANLGFVVMDEVHYLADKLRGPVWEEIIIHLNPAVQLVSLSATVSNVEEFGAWLNEVRGSTEIILSERRPVPLWQHVLTNHELIAVFLDEDGNPTPVHGPFSRRRYREINPLLNQLQDQSISYHRPRIKEGGRRGYRKNRVPKYEREYGNLETSRWKNMKRYEIIEYLAAAQMLPAIFFIFSRKGCDQAVTELLRAQVSLTNDEERAKIKQSFKLAFADISDEDAYTLNLQHIERAAVNGIAAHHAGQLPAVKVLIEELFAKGLIKAVFATETLALGINMPAKSVVIDKLLKFNGTEHAAISPGEYTQLTGRAGRRGIDTEGHAVVVVSNSADARAVAGLASTRTYPLKSAFQPNYNMAVNLLKRYPVDEARKTLEASFAQFHTDRNVIGQAKRANELEETVKAYSSQLNCSQGDLIEYANLQAEVSKREKELSRIRAKHKSDKTKSLISKLKHADVVAISGARRPSYAVVVQNQKTLKGPVVTVINTDAKLRDLEAEDFGGAPLVLTTMATPSIEKARSSKVRKDTAQMLKEIIKGNAGVKARPQNHSVKVASLANNDQQLAQLKTALLNHPCHSCPDLAQHMRWMARYRKALSNLEKINRTIRQRTTLLSRQFDSVLEVLTSLNYVTPNPKLPLEVATYEVSAKGELLERIFSERDLLICEAISNQVFDDLKPQTLAAVASVLSFEARKDQPYTHNIQDSAFGRTLHALDLLLAQIHHFEKNSRQDLTPEPQLGMADAVYRWALGMSFTQSLLDIDVAPGDFVRHIKQVVDLLDHISHLPAEYSRISKTAATARKMIFRGIVAEEL